MPDPSDLWFRSIRLEYHLGALDEADLAAEPMAQFGRWLAAAVEAGVPEPNAMVLATASARAEPAARIVLLKEHLPEGFVFFSNYESRKGRDLAENAVATLLFPWFWMQRQVTVTGPAERLAAEESEAYFASRPREAQLGAWASRQSSVLESRAQLEQRLAEAAVRFGGQEQVPRPPFWGGYLVRPDAVEFWQGRPGRLHDRLRYLRAPEGSGWHVQRLSP